MAMALRVNFVIDRLGVFVECSKQVSGPRKGKQVADE